MKKHAVFDCDDVLVNLRDESLRIASKIMGRNVTLRDLTDTHVPACFDECTPDQHEEFTEFFTTGVDLMSLKPDPMARYVLESLKRKGYKISVVTARGMIPNAQTITEQYFKKHNMPVDEVHVVQYHKSKRDTLAKLGDITVYVEDNHHHAECAHGLPNVKRILLMDRPWNQEFQNKYGISCTSTGKIKTIHELGSVLETLQGMAIDTKLIYKLTRLYGYKRPSGPHKRHRRYGMVLECKNTTRLLWMNHSHNNVSLSCPKAEFDRWANSRFIEMPYPTTECELINMFEMFDQEIEEHDNKDTQ